MLKYEIKENKIWKETMKIDLNNLMLKNKLSERLYFDIAEKLPIIDFHNHLDVKDLAKDRRFENIYEMWIKSDPYKHRAMRICGIKEEYITGGASGEEKFILWCSIFHRLLGNPLYHWSLLELKRVFDIDLVPNRDNAQLLWNEMNEKLENDSALTCKGLIERFNVEYAAPCASPEDNINIFKNCERIVPSFRADKLLIPERDTVKKLSEISGIEIHDFDDYKEAVIKRIDDFNSCGCSFSDHAIDNGFKYVRDDGKNSERFILALNRGAENMPLADKQALFSEMLRFLGEEYSKRGWTMQLHIGALRETSSRLRAAAGAAGGFAAAGDDISIYSLTNLLDDIEKSRHGLARTLLYTLNPAYNAVMSVLSGSYSKDGVSSLISQGPAWWWCDHPLGMREVFDAVASYGILSEFIGMTTDSRSILSLSRHEYFRRVLCSYISEKVISGEFPNDERLLEELVRKMCYKNAKEIILEGKTNDKKLR